MVVRVAANLAERHFRDGCAAETDLAAIKHLALIRTVGAAATGIDGHVRGRFGIAAAGVRCFFVYEMHFPGDLGGRVVNLFARSVVVVGEYTKACGLALDATLWIFV